MRDPRQAVLALLLLNACEPLIGLDELEFVLPPAQSSSTSSAPPGDERLALALGGEGSDSFGGLDVDADRRLLVAGTFESTLDLGAGALSSDGGDDFFVAAFEPTGTLVWQAQLGGAGDQSTGVSVTPSAAWAPDGEAVLFGPFAGTITRARENSVAAERDLFVARFESSGAERWFLHATGEGPEDGAGLSVHGDGSASFVAINASSPLTLGGETSSTPTTALLHGRVAAGGSVTALEGFASPAAGLGVTALDDGGVVLVGHTSAPSANFDCGTRSGPNQPAAVVVRRTANGQCEWSYRFGGTGTSSARAVIATAERALVVGIFDGSLDGPDRSVSCAAATCGFVAALALASEELVWLRALDGAARSAIEPRDLALGEKLRVVGTFAGTLDGPDGSWSAQDTDGFALELDPSNGDVLGGFALGGAAQDRLLAVALDSTGALVLGGDYESSGVSVADLTLPAPRERDLFILRVAP